MTARKGAQKSKAEAAFRRLVILSRARANPRMRIDKCAGSTVFAEILDPGRRGWTKGGVKTPPTALSEMPRAFMMEARIHTRLSLKHRVFYKKGFQKM